MMLVTDVLRKKRFGGELTHAELEWFLTEFLQGRIQDYQLSALLMAICLQGMTARETADLTVLMRDSGRVFNFSHLKKFVVDKHSTGGVGDKTSLIVAPLVAAAGLAVPMVAGRGLGHTGGTLDKLESLPGFRVDLTHERFEQVLATLGFAIMGQTADMCPADKRMYALRDVTGTVDSQPLICASIMSKKLAEGLDGLVLDVKFGSGAFMKTLDEAQSLARALKHLGESAGVAMRVVLTDMNQPLGRFVGNALEVIECLDILKGKTSMDAGVDFYADTRELSLDLAGHMIHLGQPHQSLDACRNLAEGILASGKAYENFEKMTLAQGQGLPVQFKTPYNRVPVVAPRDGRVAAMDCETMGQVCVELGAGRKTTDQKIDPWCGLEMGVKIGMPVLKGQPLLYVHGRAEPTILRALEQAITISNLPVPPPIRIAQVI